MSSAEVVGEMDVLAARLSPLYLADSDLLLRNSLLLTVLPANAAAAAAAAATLLAAAAVLTAELR